MFASMLEKQGTKSKMAEHEGGRKGGRKGGSWQWRLSETRGGGENG